ncbi:MAG: transcription elongation factor Spt5 [Candidatus Aenigmarchaeota archaeon]|nr:transcription elongation factor Spt5 [Candidatus Aenigmarchaeota archaeon]MCX8190766.1 transcription elongation factor Spt5 [Candidatus Aenigmarchaeota archaeon]MDW8160013.1 transcription elongation factor Spt5 [Candidatus Aenigmarchaeota archaeon]
MVEGEIKQTESLDTVEKKNVQIYVVRTIVGRENVVVDSILSRAKKNNIPIKAIMHPEEIKGYVFVEGDIRDVREATRNVVNIRGIVASPVKMEEIEKFLKPKETKIEVGIGDIIEVISGPFKDTRGKVTRIDNIKREVTIEPLEVPVPIPITISVEFIKIIERKK